ncbi:hypothetical protein AB0M46_31440 [Dactylosporangium sp. NPDC051485]|uniref:hypothetical protein n=1 Tax=Dactylosporangium sp. NPDC051485 TaxID=3154846 RepID=UPI00342474BF
MPEMDIALKEAMQIDGALGAALVDHSSGMALSVVGGSQDFDLTIAAAGNSDVVRAELRAMELLGLEGAIEDVLVTLKDQYHLIRPLTGRAGRGLFLYLVLARSRANLALARHHLRRIEENIQI